MACNPHMADATDFWTLICRGLHCISASLHAQPRLVHAPQKISLQIENLIVQHFRQNFLARRPLSAGNNYPGAAQPLSM